jgi:purine/pyrimidine-nucleoside phosphorylase
MDQFDKASQFDKVSVVKKANVYFDGKVVSRTVLSANGEKKTLGFMQKGEYEFSTADKEVMELLAGSMDVLIKDETNWKTYQAGDSFTVPANSSFKLRVPELADYCCSYIQ